MDESLEDDSTGKGFPTACGEERLRHSMSVDDVGVVLPSHSAEVLADAPMGQMSCPILPVWEFPSAVVPPLAAAYPSGAPNVAASSSPWAWHEVEVVPYRHPIDGTDVRMRSIAIAVC